MPLSDLAGNPFAGLLGTQLQGLSSQAQSSKSQALSSQAQAQQQMMHQQAGPYMGNGAWQAASLQQQSGLLNQQGQYQQGLQNSFDSWWRQTPPCDHEIVDGSCKHCSESAPSLVAKALKRKKRD